MFNTVFQINYLLYLEHTSENKRLCHLSLFSQTAGL
jgi:hypothetical protein